MSFHCSHHSFTIVSRISSILSIHLSSTMTWRHDMALRKLFPVIFNLVFFSNPISEIIHLTAWCCYILSAIKKLKEILHHFHSHTTPNQSISSGFFISFAQVSTVGMYSEYRKDFLYYQIEFLLAITI